MALYSRSGACPGWVWRTVPVSVWRLTWLCGGRGRGGSVMSSPGLSRGGDVGEGRGGVD